MKKALKEVISAIENGYKIEDSRGTVYKQEFGIKFLDYLKKSVENNDLENQPKQERQGYICPKTNKNCDDEMCYSASNCNIDNSLIKESKNFSFEEISNQFHQIAKDYKDEFNSDDETKIVKTHSDNQERMPKQETLEEAAEKYDSQYINRLRPSFIAGAKWQQEQDKNMFSEEEVEVLIKTTYEETMRAMVDWFVNNKDKNQEEMESAIENYVYPRLAEKGIKFKNK